MPGAWNMAPGGIRKEFGKKDVFKLPDQRAIVNSAGAFCGFPILAFCLSIRNPQCGGPRKRFAYE